MYLTLIDYWMGRDLLYPAELTDEIRQNAVVLLGRVNLVLILAKKDGVAPGIDEVTGTYVASGWRPSAVNDRTSNAAKGSTHLTAEGIDLQECAGRMFARWCLAHLDVLEAVDLWMEDPQWTPTWVHLQSRPPRSGNRVFIPSTRPPLIARLPEQLKLA